MLTPEGRKWRGREAIDGGIALEVVEMSDWEVSGVKGEESIAFWLGRGRISADVLGIRLPWQMGSRIARMMKTFQKPCTRRPHPEGATLKKLRIEMASLQGLVGRRGAVTL